MLILREVLRWQATEVAELLDTSVASVNSALQRARATLAGPATSTPSPCSRRGRTPPTQQELLARYVDAFERYDIDALVSLLHEDAVQSMPPYHCGCEGPDEIGRWLLGHGHRLPGSRLVPTAANGGPAFGQYRLDPDGGPRPWALHVSASR